MTNRHDKMTWSCEMDVCKLWKYTRVLCKTQKHMVKVKRSGGRWAKRKPFW